MDLQEYTHENKEGDIIPFYLKPYDQQMKQTADWDEVPFLNIPDGTVHLHTNDRMEPQQSPPDHYRD